MEPKYDPPYPLSKLPKHLINDPVHRWRATTGIELIHEEPTYEEFERISNNWNLMPNNMKKQSDAKAMEFFGYTNAANMERLKARMLLKRVKAQNYKSVRELFQPASAYNYGLYIKGQGLVTDSSKFHAFDPKRLLLQSPASFEKNKGGMCHDATLYVHDKLDRQGIPHKGIYVESEKKPYRPTHSFVVAEIGRDDWRIIDLFSRKGGLYEESFKSWQDAAQFRSSLWADEEKLTDSPKITTVMEKFPTPGSDIMAVMRTARKGTPSEQT